MHAFATELWVPQPVAEEIFQQGPQDITAKAIDDVAWLIIKGTPRIPTAILEWRLGVVEHRRGALDVLQPKGKQFPGPHAGLYGEDDQLAYRVR